MPIRGTSPSGSLFERKTMPFENWACPFFRSQQGANS
jgi:hypothetical protein